MAIYRLLKFSAFDPEEIAGMTAAYEDALRVFQLANRQDPITELVAKKIIEQRSSASVIPTDYARRPRRS